jgi:hypothetical protein
MSGAILLDIEIEREYNAGCEHLPQVEEVSAVQGTVTGTIHRI